MPIKMNFDLIVTIIRRGHAEKVVEAAKEAGAEGGTIICGRGTGIHEKKKIMGLSIEPEKEIVLTLIPEEKCREVLNAIIKAGELDKPATGISFVLDVKEVAGIVHLLEEEDG